VLGGAPRPRPADPAASGICKIDEVDFLNQLGSRLGVPAPAQVQLGPHV